MPGAFDAVAWQQGTDGTEILSSPAIAAGIAVFGGGDGEVHAVRVEDGSTVWSLLTGYRVAASPATGQGLAYLPSLDGTLRAVALEDGTTAWTRSLGGQAYSSPILAGTRLIAGCGFPNSRVLALDSPTGDLLWETAPGAIQGIVYSSAAVSGNLVLVGSTGGRYYGLDLETGAVVWTFDTGGTVYLSSPMVSGGRAFVVGGGADAGLYALVASTGAIEPGWPVVLADPLGKPVGNVLQVRHAVSSPVDAAGRVVVAIRFDYYVDTDSNSKADTFELREYVAAVDAATAQVEFMAANGSKVTSNVNEIPGLNLLSTPAGYLSTSGAALVAVTSSVQNRVRLLDVHAGGEEVWSRTVTGPGQSSPVVAAGVLLVATSAGWLEGFLSYDPAATLTGSPPPGPDASSNGPPFAVVTTAATIEALLPSVSGPSPSNEAPATAATTAQAYVDLPPVIASGLGAVPEYTEPTVGGASWESIEPTVLFNGRHADTLVDAIDGARPGDVIELGVGRFVLSRPTILSEGTILRGTSPMETVIDLGLAALTIAPILPAGRQVGEAPEVGASGVGGGRTEIANLRIQAGSAGVVVRGVGDLEVRNVLFAGAEGAGVEVGGMSRAVLDNVTIAACGVGVEARGDVLIRNSILAGNGVGLWREAGARAVTEYSNVYGNGVDRGGEGTPLGKGDIEQPVDFIREQGGDFRELPESSTIDAGDPAGAYDREPEPNGGRINMGAFGNTVFAAARGDHAGGGCVTVWGESNAGLVTGPWFLAVLIAWALARCAASSTRT